MRSYFERKLMEERKRSDAMLAALEAITGTRCYSLEKAVDMAAEALEKVDAIDAEDQARGMRNLDLYGASLADPFVS